MAGCKAYRARALLYYGTGSLECWPCIGDLTFTGTTAGDITFSVALTALGFRT